LFAASAGPFREVMKKKLARNFIPVMCERVIDVNLQGLWD
jgi:hypothetical protein